MCGLLEMQKRAEYARDNMISIAASCMLEINNEFELVALNKQQLYDLGIDSTGNKLSPYRSKYYADMKFELRGIELTDLFLSGEWQRNFYIEIDGEMYRINSTDEKTAALIEKYGDNIFGFTDENKTKAFFIIKPSFVEKINDILML